MFKKISLIGLLISSVIIAGCGIEKEDNKETTTMTESQIFEKKKECISYKDKIITEIKKRNDEYTYDGKESYEELNTIFYSIKRNSCIYDTKGFFKYFQNQKQETRDQMAVYDFLSNERIYQTPSFCNKGRTPFGITQCLDEYNNFLQELEQIK